MAITRRKEAAAETTPARKETRSSGGSGGGAAPSTRMRWIDRQRENIRNVMAELRKVTWPTREETRNLTIVVIGISAAIGTSLALIDIVLSSLYRMLNPS
ncbi:MAG TPA: preprotein translocase subunit SecE [Chloroflexia bacterium]|nr:preprotein translocase subunit SecE [Chloroflexia bacterium]